IYPFEFGPLFDGVTPFFLLLETGNVDLYEIVSDALTFDENAEDEHDVVWFWLEKGKLHECPVCSQYFVVSGYLELENIDFLEVVGPGGPPDGHGDDRH
ncbi:hypothetical protein Gotri_025132, partial [Gossypium trilobum]|nr:hypothetical protein [Gossypium trilobum]